MIHAQPNYHPTRNALIRIGAPRFGFGARFFWVCLFGALGWVSSGPRAADTPTVRGRGYTYVHQKLSEGPWSIHIFDIDRSNTDIELLSNL